MRPWQRGCELYASIIPFPRDVKCCAIVYFASFCALFISMCSLFLSDINSFVIFSFQGKI